MKSWSWSLITLALSIFFKYSSSSCVLSFSSASSHCCYSNAFHSFSYWALSCVFFFLIASCCCRSLRTSQWSIFEWKALTLSCYSKSYLFAFMIASFHNSFYSASSRASTFHLSISSSSSFLIRSFSFFSLVAWIVFGQFLTQAWDF